MMSKVDNNPTKNVIGAETGFTLIELLVAMAAGIIVLAAIIGMFSNLTQSYTTETVRASAQQDVRSALALMCEDIIHAGLDPTGTAGSSITTLGATDIEFTADMNYDGDTADNNEWVRYFLNGNELRQQIKDSTGAVTEDDVLLDNVTDLSFVYLDEDENATTTADDVRIVQITMTIQPPAGRAGSVTRTLSQQVRLRNALS
ncbi:hypothetical protein [uncultured Desulfosarcina sp.]|uniref:PilW family protein n=1 Tax=uncultured Desulfosarcina sp. TaxID=218289 RepID=UPI0029C78DBF|nr:hypothetical protein [uncultured Desulfosarcina sp.]